MTIKNLIAVLKSVNPAFVTTYTLGDNPSSYTFVLPLGETADSFDCGFLTGHFTTQASVTNGAEVLAHLVSILETKDQNQSVVIGQDSDFTKVEFIFENKYYNSMLPFISGRILMKAS